MGSSSVKGNLTSMQLSKNSVVSILIFSVILVNSLNSRTATKRILNKQLLHQSKPHTSQDGGLSRFKGDAISEMHEMLSITNNFEVLRRRYMQALSEHNRMRVSKRKKDKYRIQENQSILDNIG